MDPARAGRGKEQPLFTAVTSAGFIHHLWIFYSYRLEKGDVERNYPEFPTSCWAGLGKEQKARGERPGEGFWGEFSPFLSTSPCGARSRAEHFGSVLREEWLK